MRGRGIVVAVASTAALAFFYVWQRTHVIQLGYDVEALKAEKKKLQQTHNHLLIETSTLASLERVERIATQNLGMKRPESGQIVMVDSRTVSVSADMDTVSRESRAEILRVAQVTDLPRQKSLDEQGLSLLQRLKNVL
jgi:cell division protein FtsL